jgi:hypothetical protein
MSKYLNSAFALATAAVAFVAAPAWAAPTPDDPLAALSESKNSPNAKIGPWLDNLYQEYVVAQGKGVRQQDFRTTNKALRVANGTVAVDALATNGAALTRSLRAMGASVVSASGPLVSARVPVSALGRLAADPALAFARPVMATTNAGLPVPAVSQGVGSLSITPSPDGGGGLTVGVLSDSINCNPPAFVPGAPTTTFQQDKVIGELPPDVTVLDPGPCPATDEGRAMGQIVHDVAPGAAISFHTAFNGEFDFANSIIELQQKGANVIVDDVIYFAEPFFSDGAIAQAVDIVVGKGAPYFSSAGNQARSSYESGFRGVNVLTNAGNNFNGGKAVVRRFHDFAGDGTGILQPVAVLPGSDAGLIIFSFQWDQPFKTATAYAWLQQGKSPEEALALAKGAISDLDFVIFDDKGHALRRCPPGVAKGITCQYSGVRNIGGDAVELTGIYYSGPPKTPQLFYVGIVLAEGPDPGKVKYAWFENDGAFAPLAFDTQSGTAFGHSNAAGTIAVGAASWYATLPYSTSGLVPPNDTYNAPPIAPSLAACTPACLNDFSSAGGIPIYLDKFGNRLLEPQVRQTPSVTGPDGGNTSFFFSDSSYDDDNMNGLNSPRSTFITPLDQPQNEYPNFFGTSASAPHIAAVAALMLQKSPGLTPADVRDVLQDTAGDISLRFISARPIVTLPIPNQAPGGYDFDSGYGMVNAAAALDTLD